MTVYLADTHLVIWALDEFEKLTDAHAEIWTSDAEIWISYASVWEMTIKAALGKLRTPDDLVGTIMRSRLEALPIGLPHIDTLRALPPHHRTTATRLTGC